MFRLQRIVRFFFYVKKIKIGIALRTSVWYSYITEGKRKTNLFLFDLHSSVTFFKKYTNVASATLIILIYVIK